MLTYYVVLYQLGDTGAWTPADMQAVPDSYESYPVMYMTRERAEKWAAGFMKEAGADYETAVVEVHIRPPTK